MARKKKTRKSKFRGALGGPGKKPQSGAAVIDPSFIASQNRFIEMLENELSNQSFRDEDELQRYLNEHFTGHPVNHFLEEWEERDESAEGRANRILAEAAGSDNPEIIRAAALEALRIDPENINAKMDLAMFARSIDKKIALISRATNQKRRELVDTIREARECEVGLWYFPEARPFLQALADLAAAYRVKGAIQQTIGIQKEILELNPSDNQGVRWDLLVNYFTISDWNSAEELLETYVDEETCDSLFGRALLDFHRAMDRAEKEENWYPTVGNRLPFESAPDYLFEEARESLKNAVCAYPWSLLFLIDFRVLMLDSAPIYQCGSPTESLNHAHRAFHLWAGGFHPGMWLITEGIKFLPGEEMEKKLIKHALNLGELILSLDKMAIDFKKLGEEHDLGEIGECMAMFHGFSELIEKILISKSGLDRSWN